MKIVLAGDPDAEVFEVTVDELESMREWREGTVQIVAFDDGGAGKLDVGGVRWEIEAFERVTKDFHPLELFRWARNGGLDELQSAFESYYSFKTRPRIGLDDYGPFLTLRRPNGLNPTNS